jgi:hypothetical protein
VIPCVAAGGEHGPMTSWLCSTGNILHIGIISGVARFLGRVITMAAHNMDFELKKKLQLFIQFPFIDSKI